MPRREDLRTILILGSGPIVIGQGCEFDYSGAQACKALREEGFNVVLVNSNPATIMTDPEFSDRTYIEPITPETVEKVVEKERGGAYEIDALLPTLGGQTALNCACEMYDSGALDRLNVEMIGATREVIYRAEDRQQFKEAVEEIGLKCGEAGTAGSMDQAKAVLERVGLPAIIRPAFTLGGSGGGVAYNIEEFEDIVRRGLDASMNHSVLIDQSLLGWKEYELEVMRDHDDNAVVICSIENFDPMGVHTGDSITVAPSQTLTDKEYQRMRDAALAIMRKIGVETGGSNVQFAINPNPSNDDDLGEMIVVEMNPRVSRSSALASKATGFPIAKIAAKLAVGYSLWELPNDITGKTVACFEPSIDYVVTKLPRWTFEKFPGADESLTTQMKSVGEAMSIGRTFKESLQKGIRSMEVKRFGYGLDAEDAWLESKRGPGAQGPRGQEGERSAQPASAGSDPDPEPPDPFIPEDKLRRKLTVPGQGRLHYVRYALKAGWTHEQVHEATRIDPWFIDQLAQLVEFEDVLCEYHALEEVPRDVLFQAKQLGYSDAQLAQLYLGEINNHTILTVRARRQALGVEPVYKLVDTCAAEFEAATPYYYSTYEAPYRRIASGPERGQGAEGPRGQGEERQMGKGEEGQRGKGREKSEPAKAPAQPNIELASPVCYLDEFEGGVEPTPSAPQPLNPSAPSSDEIRITDKPKIIILGGGPNRIGQGIEFDYCCVQAAFAAEELGFEAVMINSNPETVSTDYDTSDLLFFEPLTLEDVLNVCERLGGRGSGAKGLRGQGAEEQRGQGAEGPRGQVKEEDTDATAGSQSEGYVSNESSVDHSSEPFAPLPLSPSAPSPVAGVIVQFGGQTPLNLARGLEMAGVPIIGTNVDSIELTEDRDKFAELCRRLNIAQPPGEIAYDVDQALDAAKRIGYPVLVRPSFVLGGRAMETVYNDEQLRKFMTLAIGASDLAGQPILIDKFLAEATECDIDVVGGGRGLGAKGLRGKVAESEMEATTGTQPLSPLAPQPLPLICGVMEHIEEAGIHSGDSACTVPPYSLSPQVVQRLKDQSRALAQELDVCGLMNVQWAVRDGEIYVIEVNPRASRTVPFVGKASGVQWARLAAKAMMGQSLDELDGAEETTPNHTSVKESVFPFEKFPGVDVILGPEMRSTGECMGADYDFPLAFAKSQMAAGVSLPTRGKVFLSVRESDKPAAVGIGRQLLEMGFEVLTTGGTHQYLAHHEIETERLNKIKEGRPNAVDLIKNNDLALLINTPTQKGGGTDEATLRAMAVRHRLPMITTMTGARVAVRAIAALGRNDWSVNALQDYFPALAQAGPVRR